MMLNLNLHATPSWNEPIEMLFACHGKVKKFCGQLTMLPEYLTQNGVNQTALEAVRQICTYFNQAAPLHHADEEENFFPELLKYAPQVQADIDELEMQHQVLHENWTALYAQLTALNAGERQNLDRMVVERFTEGYACHIALEEPLFELGKTVIPLVQQQAIGSLMAARRGV